MNKSSQVTYTHRHCVHTYKDILTYDPIHSHTVTQPYSYIRLFIDAIKSTSNLHLGADKKQIYISDRKIVKTQNMVL